MIFRISSTLSRKKGDNDPISGENCLSPTRWRIPMEHKKIIYTRSFIKKFRHKMPNVASCITKMRFSEYPRCLKHQITSESVGRVENERKNNVGSWNIKKRRHEGRQLGWKISRRDIRENSVEQDEMIMSQYYITLCKGKTRLAGKSVFLHVACDPKITFSMNIPTDFDLFSFWSDYWKYNRQLVDL